MGRNQAGRRWLDFRSSFALVLAVLSVGIARSADLIETSRLSRMLPSDAAYCVAFRSSLKIEQALANSSIGNQYRSEDWQAIAHQQKVAGVGSLLNPESWFGFSWDALSGLDAQGLIFSTNANSARRENISLFIFTNTIEAQRFVQAWTANETGNISIPRRLSAVQPNLDAVWLQSPKSKRCLLVIEDMVLVSPSEMHLAGWLEQAIQRKVWTEATLPEKDKDLLAFENSMQGDLLLHLEPNEFFSENDDSSSPSLRAWKEALLPSLLRAHAVVQVPEGDEPWRIEYRLEARSELEDAAKLFSLRSDLEIAFPPFAFEGVEAWSILNVDIQEWFHGLSKAMNILIDPKVPGLFEDMVDAILTDPEGPKLDLKKELFYRCKPSVAVLSKCTNQQPSGLVRDYLSVLELQSGVDAKSMAERMFAGDEVVLNNKEGDFTIWYTRENEPLLVSAESKSVNPIRALACDNRFLLVSTSTDWLTASLRSTESSTSDLASIHAPWKLRLAPAKGLPHSILQGVDGAKSFKLDWQSVKNADDQTLLATLFQEAVLGGPRYASKIQEHVPEWEAIRSAFGTFSHLSVKDRNDLQGVLFIDRSPE